ncbi:MAG: hypothetical protein JJU27_12240 [Gammaproteobacteria bacterium]|nr:hypothetical protein [Gammaproteobacteria bacterium]
MRRRDLISAGGALAASMTLPVRQAGAERPSDVTARDPALLTAPGTQLSMVIEFTRQVDGRAVVRGRERVIYSFAADGGLTMNTHSESFDPPVIRTAIYTLGADYLPRECCVVLRNEGLAEGSAWFLIDEAMVELEGFNVRDGRLSRRIEAPEPVRALIAHAVSSDAFIAVAADRTRPGEVVPASGVYLTSADPFGRTGPDFRHVQIAMEYLGVEALATPAGTLPADHYLTYLPDAAGTGYNPFQDLWCLAGTPVFLKSYARAPFSTSYDTVVLEITPPTG